MPHILLIEDNSGDAMLVREAMRHSSVQTRFTIAEEAEEALRALNVHQLNPDLIILDLSMPKLTGLDFLERRPPCTRGIPVIVFTSSENPQERSRAHELGVRECITKPIELDSYLAVIRSAVERWSEEAEATTNGV